VVAPGDWRGTGEACRDRLIELEAATDSLRSSEMNTEVNENAAKAYCVSGEELDLVGFTRRQQQPDRTPHSNRDTLVGSGVCENCVPAVAVIRRVQTAPRSQP
jgi:hypothetical protein